MDSMRSPHYAMRDAQGKFLEQLMGTEFTWLTEEFMRINGWIVVGTSAFATKFLRMMVARDGVNRRRQPFQGRKLQ